MILALLALAQLVPPAAPSGLAVAIEPVVVQGVCTDPLPNPALFYWFSIKAEDQAHPDWFVLTPGHRQMTGLCGGPDCPAWGGDYCTAIGSGNTAYACPTRLCPDGPKCEELAACDAAVMAGRQVQWRSFNHDPIEVDPTNPLRARCPACAVGTLSACLLDPAGGFYLGQTEICVDP